MLCFSFRAAFRCWCQALDDIFKKEDVLYTWKEFGTSLTNATNSSPPGSKDYSEEFLSKVGIWGCLQGAVIAAKIAQWVWQCSELPFVRYPLCHVGRHAWDTRDSWTAMSILYKTIQFTYLWCLLSMAVSSPSSLYLWPSSPPPECGPHTGTDLGLFTSVSRVSGVELAFNYCLWNERVSEWRVGKGSRITVWRRANLGPIQGSPTNSGTLGSLLILSEPHCSHL